MFIFLVSFKKMVLLQSDCLKFDDMKKGWFVIALCIMAGAVIFLVRTRNSDREKELITEIIVLDNDPILQPDASNVKPETSNLINIRNADSTILVDLKYATTDNFTGVILYDGIDDAYLQPDVALMLAEAHRYLKTLHPDLRFLVYDAVRPLSVQRIMWERVKDTQYSRYVASPDRLSLHNFGAAVDLTLADNLGHPLDMGTPFDFFGRAAGISDEQGLITQGILTRQQVQNRQLLRQVMRHAGFHSISGEWWHFNACSLQEAKQRYTLVE